MLVLFGFLAPRARATFSIVAVDTLTGEVGGAGASCIGNVFIINDLVEGVGAIHTQAFWLPENKANAAARLAEGLEPDSIISWLDFNDFQGHSEFRQYLVVTHAPQGGSPQKGASAGWTGFDTTPFANHRLGPGYSIAGNILLGVEILDTMESAFLNTPGPLEEKLMAAMEAAKIPGADTRCLPSNKSAISAFIKVVRIGDGPTPYLEEIVATSFGSNDPIDQLRVQFDAWKALRSAHPDSSLVTITLDTLPTSGAAISNILITPLNPEGDAPNQVIDSIFATNTGDGTVSAVTNNNDGTYSATITSPTTPGVDSIVVTVHGGGQSVELSARPDIFYYLCGDADGTGDISISDAVFVVRYIFTGGDEPKPILAAESNGSGDVEIGDATYIVRFIFTDGDPPVCP